MEFIIAETQRPHRWFFDPSTNTYVSLDGADEEQARITPERLYNPLDPDERPKFLHPLLSGKNGFDVVPVMRALDWHWKIKRDEILNKKSAGRLYGVPACPVNHYATGT